MEIKRFGDMQGNTIMLLHGNLMCWRQFEDPAIGKEIPGVCRQLRRL